MPEQIRCPECDATLRVPDSLLGKMVKCPKCQTTFTAEIEEPEERERIVREPAPSAARRRPRLSDEDEEEEPPEEEEEEDRPRRPKRRRRGRSSSVAKTAVSGPAIALMITGGLGILAAIVYLLLQIWDMSLRGSPPPPGQSPPGYEVGLRIGRAFAFTMVGLGTLWSILLLIGGLKMKNLQNYGLAMTTCVLAILPLNCCCLLGLPFGIWGLVVLNKPEVKDAFS